MGPILREGRGGRERGGKGEEREEREGERERREKGRGGAKGGKERGRTPTAFLTSRTLRSWSACMRP